MSDEAAYHIIMGNENWPAVVHELATSQEQVAKIIGRVLSEHGVTEADGDIDIVVIYGTPVEIKIRTKEVSVVQVGVEKFLVGAEAVTGEE